MVYLTLLTKVSGSLDEIRISSKREVVGAVLLQVHFRSQYYNITSHVDTVLFESEAS